jgi:hypothetical protein
VRWGVARRAVVPTADVARAMSLVGEEGVFETEDVDVSRVSSNFRKESNDPWMAVGQRLRVFRGRSRLRRSGALHLLGKFYCDGEVGIGANCGTVRPQRHGSHRCGNLCGPAWLFFGKSARWRAGILQGSGSPGGGEVRGRDVDRAGRQFRGKEARAAVRSSKIG